MHSLVLFSVICLSFFFSSSLSFLGLPCPSENLSKTPLIRGIPINVISDKPILVYSDASTDSQPLAQLDSPTQISIIDDPQCNKKDIWWKVRLQEKDIDKGYILQKNTDDFQLLPIIQPLYVPSDNPIISADNVQKLQSIASVDYQWPLELVWSPDSSYLAISTPWAVWIHHVTDANDVPFAISPTAQEVLGKIGNIRFSADSKTVAVVDLTGNLQITSLSDQSQQTIKNNAPDYMGVAAISPDLSKWVTANWDGSMTVWDGQTGKQVSLFKGHIRVGGIAFTPDGSILVTHGAASYSGIGTQDDTVRIWDANSGNELSVFEINPVPAGNGGPSSDIAISADGRTAGLFGFRESKVKDVTGVIHLIDIPKRSIQMDIPISGNGGLDTLSFSPDNHMIAVNFSSTIIFIDPSSGLQLTEHPFIRPIHDVAFSPNGTWIAIGHETGAYVGAGKVEILAIAR